MNSKLDEVRPSPGQLVDVFEMYVAMHDTDSAGVVYAVNPALWAGIGAENIFRSAGHPLEALMGAPVHFPVVRVEINHVGRLPLGANVTVTTWVGHTGNTSFRFDTRIERDGELCATVSRVAVSVQRGNGPVPLPQWVRQLGPRVETAARQ